MHNNLDVASRGQDFRETDKLNTVFSLLFFLVANEVQKEEREGGRDRERERG